MDNKKFTILIADDEANILDIYSQALAMADYYVIQARDGKEVLNILKDRNPAEKIDLFLLDILMPKLDGFDTLAKLKKEKNWRDAPVIMLSNLNKSEDIAEANKLGAAGFLVKVQTGPHQLVKKVSEILNKEQ